LLGSLATWFGARASLAIGGVVALTATIACLMAVRERLDLATVADLPIARSLRIHHQRRILRRDRHRNSGWPTRLTHSRAHGRRRERKAL
jgi:hypothetical protein